MTEKITPKKGDAVTVWEVVPSTSWNGEKTAVYLLSRDGVCTGKMIKFTAASRAKVSGITHRTVTAGYNVQHPVDGLCFTPDDAISDWQASCVIKVNAARKAYEEAKALASAEIIGAPKDGAP